MTKSKITFKLVVCILLIFGVIESYKSFPQVVSEDSITDIEILLNSQPIIFASTISGHVFRSPNSGKSWKEVTQHLPKKSIVKSLSFVAGMKISKNTITVMGRSKKQPPISIEKLKGILLATTKHDGVFYSTDLGEKWVQLELPGLPNNVSITDVVSDAKGRIFIGTEKDGVFILKNKRWISVDPTVPEVFEVKQLAISPRDCLTLYAVVPHGIYTLKKKWEIILYPFPYGIFWFYDSERWELIKYFKKPIVNTVLVDPTSPGVFYIGSTRGLYRFDNNKKSTKKSLSDKNITAIAFSKPSKLFLGTANDLLYTLNIEKSLEKPIENAAVGNTVTVLKNSSSLPSTLFAGTDKGIYVTEDNGASWHLIFPQKWGILPWVIGIGLTFILVLFIVAVRHLRKRLDKQKETQVKRHKDQKSVPENFSTQIQEAFDSLKRSETPGELLKLNKAERFYVDYRKNLESLLQQRNDYIVGYHGAGKTIIFGRAFIGCTKSWEQGYLNRGKQSLKINNVLAVYLSLKKFELADFSHEDNTKKIEKQFVQSFIKNMLDQIEKYPSSLRKQVKKLFANEKNTQSTVELLDKIQKLLEKSEASMIYLFLDDFSGLNLDLQVSLSRIFRNIILANKKLYIKLAVVPKEFNLGEIEPQRDMVEFSLNLNDIVNNSTQPKKDQQKILDISYEIINRRLNFYTEGRLSFDDIAPGNRSEIIRIVFDFANGIPRTMGLILSQSWRLIVNSGKYYIDKNDLWKPKSSFE